MGKYIWIFWLLRIKSKIRCFYGLKKSKYGTLHRTPVPFCSLRWYHCSLKWSTRLSTFPTSYLVDETFLDRITMTNRVYDNEMIIQKSNINQNWHRRDVGRLQSWGIKKSKKIPPETNLILCNGKVTQKILWFPEKVDQLHLFRFIWGFQHRFWLYNSVQSK